jgi:hypothetical protein
MAAMSKSPELSLSAICGRSGFFSIAAIQLWAILHTGRST